MQDNVLFWARLIGTGHVGAIAPLLPRATWITPVTQPSARTRCDMWGPITGAQTTFAQLDQANDALCFIFFVFHLSGFVDRGSTSRPSQQVLD